MQILCIKMSFPSKDFYKFPQQKGGKPKRFYEKKLLPPTTSSHIAYKQKTQEND